jgi:Invasion associated locus B (IalB) protein
MTGFRIAVTAFSVVLAAAPMSVTFAQQPSPPPAAPKAAAPKATAPKAAAPKSATANPTTATGDSQPTLLGQYGDWGAYAATPGGKKICFVLAKPKVSKTEPAGRSRDPAYMFISSRPADNVKNEVSVIIGYPFKTSSDATVEVGGAKFAMYTQNDGAWIKNVADEARMVDAMRKAADVTVKGTSGKGAQSSDQYSLKGLAQALERVDQECR